MNKKLLVMIALVLVAVLSLSSCGIRDWFQDKFGSEVELTDAPLNAEKLIDFAEGANPDVLFESDGWSNGDVFNVVWKSHNVHYENGIMRLGITEEKASAWLNDAEVEFNYTAGEARTQNYYHYGDYEVSMKPSANGGTASTFFVCTGPYDLKDGVPNAHDEIDIEFLGDDTTHVQFNFFVDGKGGNEYMYDLGFDASEEFHRYGFRWEENAITWFVDGVPVYKVTTDKSVESGKNLRIVEKLPSTAGRILTNYWCGNERAWGWMGKYEGETTDNGTTYQWIATSAVGAPLNPPVVTPPAGGGDVENTEIDWTAIDPIVPAFPSAAPYVVTVDGNSANVTYTDVSGSAYMPIELDVTDAVAGKNYVYLKVTNNGTETVNVRVNMFDPTLTGNNKATNISATMNGQAVRTDLEWGGSFFDIPAGETAELVVNFGVGGIKLQLMIDSSRNDSVLRSGDVTVEAIKFAAVGEVVAPHKCEDANEDGKCDGCGNDMPATPPPAPADPVSGNLTSTVGGVSVQLGGNVTDGYGVHGSEDGKIKVEYTNITTNTYKNVWVQISDVAAGKKDISLKIKNNGEATAYITVKIEAVGAVALMEGKMEIPAGAEQTFTGTFTGVADKLYFFIDSGWSAENTTHAGEVIISEIAFAGQTTPPAGDDEDDDDDNPTNPPVDTGLQLPFYPEENTGYTVEGLNIKYTGKGNTYKPVTSPDVTALATGKNTFTVTITNNGTVATRVRVDVQGTTWVSTGEESGTDACNKSSTGGDSWTDTTWGGSAVTVPAGEKVTLTITYSSYGAQGLVKNILVYVDSFRGDAGDYSADITLSGIAFGGEETAPAPTLPEVPTDGGYVKFEGNLDLYNVITESEYANVIQVTYSEISDNTYKNINTWIKDKADGKNTFGIVIRNNGTETVYITVKLETADEEPVTVIEKKMEIPAGQLQTLSTAFSGDAARLVLFIDSGWAETTATHSGDITVAGIQFTVTENPAPVIPEGEYLSYTGNDIYTLSATNEQYVNTLTVGYTDAERESYQNVNTYVKDKSVNKQTVSLYIKNNGTETVTITVKLEESKVGKGEKTVDVAAGETLHIEFSYSDNPDMLYLFIATGYNDGVKTKTSGEVVISGVEFK